MSEQESNRGVVDPLKENAQAENDQPQMEGGEPGAEVGTNNASGETPGNQNQNRPEGEAGAGVAEGNINGQVLSGDQAQPQPQGEAGTGATRGTINVEATVGNQGGDVLEEGGAIGVGTNGQVTSGAAAGDQGEGEGEAGAGTPGGEGGSDSDTDSDAGSGSSTVIFGANREELVDYHAYAGITKGEIEEEIYLPVPDKVEEENIFDILDEDEEEEEEERPDPLTVKHEHRAEAVPAIFKYCQSEKQAACLELVVFICGFVVVCFGVWYFLFMGPILNTLSYGAATYIILYGTIILIVLIPCIEQVVLSQNVRAEQFLESISFVLIFIISVGGGFLMSYTRFFGGTSGAKVETNRDLEVVTYALAVYQECCSIENPLPRDCIEADFRYPCYESTELLNKYANNAHCSILERAGIVSASDPFGCANQELIPFVHSFLDYVDGLTFTVGLVTVVSGLIMFFASLLASLNMWMAHKALLYEYKLQGVPFGKVRTKKHQVAERKEFRTGLQKLESSTQIELDERFVQAEIKVEEDRIVNRTRVKYLRENPPAGVNGRKRKRYDGEEEGEDDAEEAQDTGLVRAERNQQPPPSVDFDKDKKESSPKDAVDF